MSLANYVVPHAISQQILKEPDPWEIYKEYYGRSNQIWLRPWQDQVCKNMLTQMRFILNWGRGMSKTILLCMLAVFFALLGMPVCYCVPRTDELTQPIKYLSENPFTDYNPHKHNREKTFTIEGKGTYFHVLGKPLIKITNIDDKGFNLSSGRFSVVIYDECSLLMYFKMERELLNKGKGLLRAMPYPHVIYASTPLIGSFFYEMYKEYPATCKSWLNFENQPDNFITDSPDKLAQLQAERSEAEAMGVLYAWETENLAIPRTASGAAFKNIIEQDYTTFPSMNPNRVGFDFHGYATGHIWVATYFDPNQSPRDIYITDEGAEVYAEADTADESMEFLNTKAFFHELYKVGESGGMINDPYIKAGRKYGMNAVSINGEEKHDLEANILNYHIHIDKHRTPKVYEDLTNAEWKDPNKFELHKEASGSKFRNHYVDAFANQLPRFTVGQGIYIPNKQLRGKSFEQLDKEAHRVRI